MLGMLKEDVWLQEVVLYFITVFLIVRNSEGHGYQPEETTGNSEHVMKWSTVKIHLVQIYSTVLSVCVSC